MIAEVDLSQFFHGLVEGRVKMLLGIRDDLVAATRVKLLFGLAHGSVEVSALIVDFLHVGESSDSGT